MCEVFFSFGEWGLLSSFGAPVYLLASLVEHGFSGVWASLIATCGFSSCSSKALKHGINSCGTEA